MNLRKGSGVDCPKAAWVYGLGSDLAMGFSVQLGAEALSRNGIRYGIQYGLRESTGRDGIRLGIR
jgi:hypothetical protein